jgi:hypothetical protein
VEGTKEIRLDRLKIIILDHGEKVRTVEKEDPRIGFVEAFNKQGAEFGLVAKYATPSSPPRA